MSEYLSAFDVDHIGENVRQDVPFNSIVTVYWKQLCGVFFLF